MKRVLIFMLGMYFATVSINAQANGPRKIRVDEGERMMGFYTTDELDNFNSGGIGLSPPATYSMAVLFDDDVIRNFVGGEITRFRFALCLAGTEVNRAFIIPCHTHNFSAMPAPTEENAVAMVDLSSVTMEAGWNDVELPEPVKIEEDTWYIIGFEYMQVSGKFPLLCDQRLNPDIVSDYGFIAYGDLMEIGYNYWIQVQYLSNLCVQAVVRGGGFSDDDIVLNNISANKYGAKGGTLPFSFDIMNAGNDVPESYTLDVAVDGEVVDHIYTPIELTALYQRVSGTLNVSEDLSSGRHTLTISVGEINGKEPEGDTDDDVVETSFMAYEGEPAERQMHLIECFTSTSINVCPIGDEVINILMENNPDKYACAEIHFSENGTDDPMAMTDNRGDAHNIESFSECLFYPSANFDRFVIDNDDVNDSKYMAIYIASYADNSVAAVQIDDVVNEMSAEVPALVSVDITPEYNADTRELIITVSGSGVKDADTVLADNRLTVYLTEDGVVSRQYSRSGWIEDYEHNNVLRLVANEYAWGDDINWTSDSSYENIMTVTLPNEWNVYNMYVVAFISGQMAYLSGDTWYWGERSEGYMNNVNKVKVAEIPEGISVVSSGTSEGGSAQYYTTDGRRVTAPMRGITIVRLADGSTKKIITK